MYRVVKAFSDLQDGRYVYHVGDVYPRDGLDVSEERVAALASGDNKRGEVLIVEVPQKAKKRPVAAENATADKSADKPKRTRKKGK